MHQAFPRAERDALVAAVAALPDHALDARVRALPGQDLVARLSLEASLAALRWQPPAAVRHLRWAPPARARLEGALLGVPDALLDARPQSGEWSLRQQLAHVELTDVRYGIATRYAAERDEDEPMIPHPSLYPPRLGEPSGTPGEPLAAVIARLRRVRAAALEPLLAIPAARLQRPTEWHTAEHTVGFRLHRFAQHDLELTTDVQATLAALGHLPTPALSIGALLVEGWSEVEALLLGVPRAIYHAVPPQNGPTLWSRLAQLCAADREALAAIQARTTGIV